MKKHLERLKDKFYGYIYNNEIDVKDRTFVLFSAMYFGALIIALIVGIFLHEPASSTISSLIIVIVSMGSLIFIVKKGIFKTFISKPFYFFVIYGKEKHRR